MLQQHPEFDLPPIKEIHYFDRSSRYTSPSHLNSKSRLRRFRKPGYLLSTLDEVWQCIADGEFLDALWKMKYRCGRYNDAWYLSLFRQKGGITGDITPAYSMLEPKDIEAMATLMPDIKIIFLIRNPIERAWSMFRFLTQFDPERDLQDLDGFMTFIDSPLQSMRSNYIQTIDRYLCHFPRESVLIGFYDAIADQPVALLREILSHIGSKNLNHPLDFELVINKSPTAPMPHQYQSFLKHHFKTQITELSYRYGSYAGLWLGETLPHSEKLPEGLQSSLHPTFHP